jgi:hypothetical protein
LELTTEKLLKGYSLDVEFWDDGFGETFMMLSRRKLLSSRTLDAAQANELASIDKKAEEMLSGHKGDETDDVADLRNVVAIIHAERQPNARQAA